MVTHLPDYCGKDNLTKFYQDQDRKKCQIGNACFARRKECLFLSVFVDDIQMAGRKQKKAPMWKKLMKLVDRWRTDIIS